MATSVNSMVVNNLLYFIYSKVCLLVTEDNEGSTMAIDNGFRSMNNEAV